MWPRVTWPRDKPYGLTPSCWRMMGFPDKEKGGAKPRSRAALTRMPPNDKRPIKYGTKPDRYTRADDA